jgi:hypothetical protein
MLKKNLIRDRQNRLVGSVIPGYADGSSLLRDAEGRLLGKTSEKFHNTKTPKAESSASTHRMPDYCSETMTDRFFQSSISRITTPTPPTK